MDYLRAEVFCVAKLPGSCFPAFTHLKMGTLQAGQNTGFRLDSPLGIFQHIEKNEKGAKTKALPKTMAGTAPGCGYTHQQQ